LNIGLSVFDLMVKESLSDCKNLDYFVAIPSLTFGKANYYNGIHVIKLNINGTTHRAVMDHKLPIKSIRRNLRRSRIRSAVKHPYAFFKNMFYFFHVMVKTVQRVRVKTYFTAMCYNLVRARFLDRIE